MFYDLAVHATQMDDARVVGKSQGRRQGRRVNTIQAKGKYAYCEDVSAQLFGTIHVGDTLHVSLTPVFTEWKKVEVVRNGQVVATARGPELYGMAAMALFLLVGVAAFLPERVLFAHLLLVITVPVLDFAAVLLGLRLVGVWMGQIEKM